MKKSEKNLAIIMGVVVILAGGYYVVLPKVVNPFLELPKEIEKYKAERTEKKQEASEIKDVYAQYKGFVDRAGGTESDKVKDDFNARLGNLMQECHLRDQRVTPKKPIEDRKLKYATVSYSIAGSGKWSDIISFIRRFYEMPQLAQLTTIKLSPVSSRRGNFLDQVKITGTIELIVPPEQKGFKDYEADAEVLENVRKKYATRQLSMVQRRNPFEPYEPPVVRHTDNTTKKKDPEPIDRGPKLDWEDAREAKTVRATLSDAILVAMPGMNGSWFPQGAKFDGGKLMFIHPLGAIVRRQEKDYVYPLGEVLQNCLDVDDALAYPEILVAWNRFVDNGGLDDIPDRESEPQEGEPVLVVSQEENDIGPLDMEGPPWSVDEFDPPLPAGEVPDDEVENGDVGIPDEGEIAEPAEHQAPLIHKPKRPSTRPVRKTAPVRKHVPAEANKVEKKETNEQEEVAGPPVREPEMDAENSVVEEPAEEPVREPDHES